MGYFMKQDLLDLIQVPALHQMLTERDSSISVVAEPRSAHRPIQPKGVIGDAVALEQLIGQGGNFLTHAAKTMGLRVSF
jgi:hypothetical protein